MATIDVATPIRRIEREALAKFDAAIDALDPEAAQRRALAVHELAEAERRASQAQSEAAGVAWGRAARAFNESLVALARGIERGLRGE